MNNFVMIPEKWFDLLEVKMPSTSNPKLTYAHLILLGKIYALTHNEMGMCFANDEYFANIMSTTTRNIQKYLDRLEKHGLIERKIMQQGFKTKTRFIRINHNTLDALLCSDTNTEQLGTSCGTIEQNSPNNTVVPNEQLGLSISENPNIHTVNCNRNTEEYISKKKRLEEPTALRLRTEEITEIIKEKVISMFREKCTYAKINNETNVSYDDIKKIIDEYKESKKKE